MRFRRSPTSDSPALAVLLIAGCVACSDDLPPLHTADAAATRATASAASAPNGCDAEKIVDRTGDAEVEIAFGDMAGYRYDPACVAVRVGTRLRFRGEFVIHPLQPGTVEGIEVTLDPANPIPSAQTGTEAVAVVTETGAFGWYCDVHIHEGMRGMVFVR